MRLWRTLRRMKTAVLLPLSVSASESGSQSRSLSVFVARHDLSGSMTIADCGSDADTDSDTDGPWSQFYFRNSSGGTGPNHDRRDIGYEQSINGGRHRGAHFNLPLRPLW